MTAFKERRFQHPPLRYMRLATTLMILLMAVTMTAPARAENCTFLQNGVASVYAEKLNGNKTASGEVLDMSTLTAAHPRLPFGTKVRVTDRRTGASTYVRINDRGPFGKKRVIDVTRMARQELGWKKSSGVHKVALAVCE